ncbi:hypothetical protein ACS0TY_027553 [Phlomoides rotata]
MEKQEATQLPEVIIQHIQSFLDVKEAARTTLLSKSWYAAWLTRPNLEFCEFPQHGLPSFLESAFVKFARKTLQRYEELNLKIQSFKLLMDDESWMYESPEYDTYFWDRISLAVECTKKAMNLGPTHLHIKFLHVAENSNFVLPGEVLESESLVRLFLDGCRIDVQDHKVSWSKLKSLRLHSVCIQGNNFWDIILRCPLIEELVLSECVCSSVKVLVMKSVLGGNHLHKLKVLSLMMVEIDECFFHDLSSKFPHLKDLVIDNCSGYEKIQICSDSLESISFIDRGTMISRVIFDVPRIKKFKFAFRWGVPSLSFKTTSTKWESHISIEWMDSSRLIKVREFIQELSPSKIHLDMFITGLLVRYGHAGDIIGLRNPPMVEELTIHSSVYAHSSVYSMNVRAHSSVYSIVMEDLFWICRPNFIVLHLSPSYTRKNDFTKFLCNDFTKFLCNALIEEGNGNQTISSLHDLEEVNVEFFEDGPTAGCRSLPCKTLLDALAYSVNSKIRICFQLRWTESI